MKLDIPGEIELYRAAFLVVHGWVYDTAVKIDGEYHGNGWFKKDITWTEPYYNSGKDVVHHEFSLEGAYWKEIELQTQSEEPAKKKRDRTKKP